MTYTNPPRPSYPVEALKHRFMPVGSLVGVTSEVDANMAVDEIVEAPEPVPEKKEKKKKTKKAEAEDAEEVKSKKRKVEDGPATKKSKKAKTGNL